MVTTMMQVLFQKIERGEDFCFSDSQSMEKNPVGPIRIVTTFTKNSVLHQYWLAATDLPLLAQYWSSTKVVFYSEN